MSWIEGTLRMRLPMSAKPLSTSFSKNFGGMKWV